MAPVVLEHINFTVRDAKATAEELCSLFDWKVRWHGEGLDGQGVTYHVGTDDTYLAIYAPSKEARAAKDNNYTTQKGLNHIGLVVPDIDEMEDRVKAAGYEPGPQWDYEPGKRFYFYNRDGIEIEIVSYS